MSNLPPVPLGGPSVTPLQAAAGVGCGEGFAGNTHNFAPTGMMAAVKYLVEDLGDDVRAVDHEGNTAMHNAAARGDVEMINYLVAKGADPKVVNREGKTTADMANGPVQRVPPFLETVDLLVKMGAKKMAEETMEDVYFAHPGRDFGKTDEALRVRKRSDGAEMSYKGPRMSMERVKAREEINLKIENALTAQRIVERLGFKEVCDSCAGTNSGRRSCGKVRSAGTNGIPRIRI